MLRVTTPERETPQRGYSDRNAITLRCWHLSVLVLVAPLAATPATVERHAAVQYTVVRLARFSLLYVPLDVGSQIRTLLSHSSQQLNIIYFNLIN